MITNLPLDFEKSPPILPRHGNSVIALAPLQF
jgi:hypothetical protein